MKRIILFMGLLLLWSNGHGQGQYLSDTTIGDILTNSERQNIWMLRDLGTFLDDPEKNEYAWQILTEKIIFLPKTFEGSKPDRQSFLHFFYDHKDAFSFDPYLQLYVFPSGNSQQLNVPFPEMEPAHFLEDVPNELDDAIFEVVSALNENKSQFAPEIIPACELLSRSRNEYAAELILECLAQGLILPSHAGRFLHRLTNEPCRLRNPIHIQHFYQSNLENKRLDEVVHSSYASLVDVNESWFPARVDYYARILNEVVHDPIAVANVLHDMQQTKESRSIYYLLGFMDRLLRKQQLSDEIFSICKKTLVQCLPASWAKTQLIPQSLNKQEIRWALEFWYTHHHQVIWDEELESFSPGFLQKNETQRPDLFTRAALQP